MSKEVICQIGRNLRRKFNPGMPEVVSRLLSQLICPERAKIPDDSTLGPWGPVLKVG